MKYYILLIIALVAFSSCKEYENSAEPSSVTYLPLIEIQGEPEIDLECNVGGYTDEGAVATEGGTSIELTTSVLGVYFEGTAVNIPDLYHITYSAENVDGIPGAETRSVTWPACNSDLVTGIEGMYTAAVFRTATSGATVDYSDAEHGPYWVVDLGGGQYGFSCVIGQFYEYGSDYGYGPAYAGTGFVVTANDISTNDFTITATNGVGAFGRDIEVTDFTVDSSAGTISWTATWSAGYEFDVVLTQN
jgi:hypothetical protein